MERNIKERLNELADAIDSGCDGKTVTEIAGGIAWNLGGEDVELEPIPGGFLSRGKRKPANDAEAIAQGVRTSAWRYLTALQNGVPTDAAQKLRGFASGLAGRQADRVVAEWSKPMQKKEIADKLGMTVRQLNQQSEKFPVEELHHKLYRLRLDVLSPAIRAKFATD